MRGRRMRFAMVLAVVAAWVATVRADPPPLTLWASQFGTNGADEATGVAVDGSGSSYIAGRTSGDLAGPNQGYSDAFIAKYDSGGAVQWMRQFGTSDDDAPRDIALDGSGNIYITGEDRMSYGDAWTAKCDSGGTVQWMREIGSTHRYHDSAQSIAVDGSGNSYITGYTSGDLAGPNQGYHDAFIVKYDSGGTVQWARQFGTRQEDVAHGIAVDGSGNSYITGWTNGDLGGPYQGGVGDTFIAKYDSGGTVQWTRQFGTSDEDRATGIALDGSGNIYITGFTSGDLGGPNQGEYDAFVVKYDSGGTVQWTCQIGSSDGDVAYDIAADGSGNSYIAGLTYGDLGEPNQGSCDVFIVACDSGGTVQWTHQIGTSEVDRAYGIATDGSGNSYISGSTYGDLIGPDQGERDAFVVALGSTLAGAGDSNLDGCTDGLDYVIWSNNYDPLTGGKAWWQGDSNEDGIADGLDYVIWSNNYLQGCPGVPGAVPEPAAMSLLAVGAVVLIRRSAR